MIRFRALTFLFGIVISPFAAVCQEQRVDSRSVHDPHTASLTQDRASADQSGHQSLAGPLVTPDDTNTYHVLPGVQTELMKWTVYNTFTCGFITAGSWSLPASPAPKYGTAVQADVGGTFAACPNYTGTFAAIYYTWTGDSTKNTTDTFSSTWSGDGYTEPETFNIVVTPAITISSPENGAFYPVLGSSYTGAGPVTVNATTADKSTVAWDLSLTYTTSGGKCAGCTDSATLNTASRTNGTKPYESMGGKLVATASDNLKHTADVTAYIVGTNIPTATEVELLDSIYPGPTKDLMSGIAQIESTTQQFVERSDFKVNQYWPTESFDGGSHIGLLQMPVAMDVAWSYSINARQGETLFTTKVATANRLMNSAIESYAGLLALNGVQLENMALVLYGPYATAGILNQYYAPSCKGGKVKGTDCVDGNWVWIVNTANNPNGVAYANKVRAAAR